MTTTGPTTLTYANQGANATSQGGSVAVLTGQYGLYPMAEVLGVYNQATKKVDGQMTLAANTVPWATGDAVEEPHYFQEGVAADTMYVGQTVPRSVLPLRAGIQYENTVGTGLRGWSIRNAAPASNYFGNGGSHVAPDDAFEVQGVWNQVLETQAGETGVIQVHCNSHGCGKWNSGYNLFEMDSSASYDSVSFQPQTSTMSFNLRGATFGFSPQGFTAGTVTAGALHGALSATDVASGTLSAARLPVFGASGAAHAMGAVPDPRSDGRDGTISAGGRRLGAGRHEWWGRWNEWHGLDHGRVDRQYGHRTDHARGGTVQPAECDGMQLVSGGIEPGCRDVPADGMERSERSWRKQFTDCERGSSPADCLVVRRLGLDGGVPLREHGSAEWIA